MSAVPYRWKPGLPADRHRRRLGAKTAAQMVKMLQDGTPTMHELVAETGLCIHTVRSYVKALHLAGACHITGWEPDKRGAYSTPRWTLGERADAARPKRVGHAAYQRARRKVIKLQAAGFRPPSVVEMARAAA